MYHKPIISKTNIKKSSTETISKIEEKLNLSCFICAHTYDIDKKKPMFICKKQHTYCMECVGLIKKTRPWKCPECRFKIYEENIILNRFLFALCQFLPALKEEIREKDKENTELMQQNIKLKRMVEEQNSMKKIIIEKMEQRSPKMKSNDIQQETERTKTEKHRKESALNPEEKKQKQRLKKQRNFEKNHSVKKSTNHQNLLKRERQSNLFKAFNGNDNSQGLAIFSLHKRQNTQASYI